MSEGANSPAKERLEELKQRCLEPGIRDDSDFDGHRTLIKSALVSSNGAQDKIGAMATTQAELVAFIVTQSLREPERLKQAFRSAHACPFKRDAAGAIIDPPWESYTAKSLEAHDKAEAAAEAREALASGDEGAKVSSINFGFFGKSLLSANGKAATVVAGVMTVVALLVLSFAAIVYWNNKELRSERIQDFRGLLREALQEEKQTASVLPYEAPDAKE